jgi:hypothetical protein
LVIYALAADGVLNTTPLYTSGTLLRPDNAIMPPNGRPATFETYPVDVDSLPAGDYIFAVRSAVDNIGIGTYYGICIGSEMVVYNDKPAYGKNVFTG